MFLPGNTVKISMNQKLKLTPYEITEDGMNVTNKHTPKTIGVNGEKTWDDEDDKEGFRPGSITIELLANGEAAVD